MGGISAIMGKNEEISEDQSDPTVLPAGPPLTRR